MQNEKNSNEFFLKAYMVLGHRSSKKLVCIKPGSRHPTVRAGAPAEN